jgi:hypothetical protein
MQTHLHGLWLYRQLCNLVFQRSVCYRDDDDDDDNNNNYNDNAYTKYLGHEEAQLVEALRYKPGRAGSVPDCVVVVFH